jgi:hypothetical protein
LGGLALNPEPAERRTGSCIALGEVRSGCGRQNWPHKKQENHLKTTWQRRAGPLNKSHWRVGHAVSARFRVLSSEIGGQGIFPIRNPIGSFWKGK